MALALAGGMLAPNLNLAQAAPSYVADPASWVDPIVGTSNGGNTFPGAVLPQGMLSFSPDQAAYAGPTSGTYAGLGYLTSASPSAYLYSRTYIRGFSLTHINGPGCTGANGDVPIFPMPGVLTQAPTAAEHNAPVRSTFSHANEHAEAGYYQVALDNGVNTELSATYRTGTARFTFPTSDTQGTVLVRSAESMVGSTDADVQIDPATQTVSGS
ncbi:MAG: glycoside hydrolase family 92 protein, partial [Propionibacteriaceae bacterium]|nr:glycoside hydrolase family 92 protein [Propionibacteriaceae bacterium]